MNPLQAFTALAQAMPVKYRRVAYLVALSLLCLVSLCVFFAIPEFLTVSWAKLLAGLGLVSAVLHGVADANAVELSSTDSETDE